MGNIPVVAEVTTSFQSLGDVMTGNPDAAAQRWKDYSEASVIGSGVRSAIAACQNDMAEAERLGKAMGRATGSALAGGGLLKNIPVFHEIATAGECLGDMIAGGDVDSANERWGNYSETSVVGSGVRSAIAAGRGEMEEARRLGVQMGLATASATVTVVGTAVTASTGGVGGVAVAGLVGGLCGAGEAAAEKAIWGQNMDAGDIVAGGLMGLAAGAIAGRKNAQGRVYSVMEAEHGQEAVQMGKFRGHQNARPNAERWVSESNRHSREYLPQRASTYPDKTFKPYQVTMDKKTLKQIRADAIIQKGSRAINRPLGDAPKNVFNNEKLRDHPRHKVNIGIKNANLESFNAGVIKVKEIDTNAWKQQGKNKLVARHAKPVLVACIASERDEK